VSSAAYRERKRAERAAAVAAAQAPAAELGVMGAALESAIAAMKWLADSDVALVTSARMLAREIDGLEQLTTSDAAARRLRAHGQLRQALDALGGSPKVRLQLELRSRRLERPPDAGAELPGNVTKFERPPKRSST
jgi:hypothetical protein